MLVRVSLGDGLSVPIRLTQSDADVIWSNSETEFRLVDIDGTRHVFPSLSIGVKHIQIGTIDGT